MNGERLYVEISRRLTLVIASFALITVAPVSRAQTGSSDGEGGVSGAVAKYLLVSTFDCFINGCQYENAVLRYDAQTGAFLGVHIAGLPGPHGMAVHPTRGTLLVASRSTDVIKEYHLRTGAFIRDFITAGPEGMHVPQAILFKPNGNLLVTSTQTDGFLNRFNGILEFNGSTGAYVADFVDGGFLGLDCDDPQCLFGANSMVLGNNNNLYVTNGNYDQILEYNINTGAYLGKFESTQLKFPTGIVVRPLGGTRPGNILVTSRYRDMSNPNDLDKILEFDKQTRQQISPGGVFANGLVEPGPLRWGLDGNLLVDDRAVTQQPPLYADRILKLNKTSGAFLGTFTLATDNHIHVGTAMLQVDVVLGSADDDFDSDGDVDLMDYGGYQRCFGSAPSASCLDAFDDDQNGLLDQADTPAFHLQFSGPLP